MTLVSLRRGCRYVDSASRKFKSLCVQWRNCAAGEGRIAGSGNRTVDVECEVCGGDVDATWNAADDISSCVSFSCALSALRV